LPFLALILFLDSLPVSHVDSIIVSLADSLADSLTVSLPVSFIDSLADSLTKFSHQIHSLHQEKKSASGRTGCVRTHQALGTIWTHPGRAHTAPNAKRTGNVNSDAACHGTVHSDAICQDGVRLDAARHGICLPDGACQGIFLLDTAVSGHFPSGRSHVRAFSFWTQPYQSIFLLGAAVSGQMASGLRVSWHHGHAVCQGTEHRSK